MVARNPITQFLRERALTRAAPHRERARTGDKTPVMTNVSVEFARGAPLLSPPGFGSRHAECGGEDRTDACSRMVVEGCAASVRAEGVNETYRQSRRRTTSTRSWIASGPVRLTPPVPEYIRLIAAGRYSDAYMVNWKSNVFPGILGRTCDRPCEPACRRVRVENEPSRDLPPQTGGVPTSRMTSAPACPSRAAAKNGKRIALVGGWPRLAHGRARPGAARAITAWWFDQDPKAGGMIRTQISALPSAGIDHRRGMRLYPQPRHRISRRQAHRQPQGAAGGRLGCDLRRLGRACGGRDHRRSRPQGSGGEHPYRHRLALIGLLRPRQQNRQSA